jgi:hypothetical protein
MLSELWGWWRGLVSNARMQPEETNAAGEALVSFEADDQRAGWGKLLGIKGRTRQECIYIYIPISGERERERELYIVRVVLRMYRVIIELFWPFNYLGGLSKTPYNVY